MGPLLTPAKLIAERLRARKETLAIAESSAGGLISAALLAMPGASAFFLGGIVVYTRTARAALLGISTESLGSIRPSTEPYAQLLADTARAKLGATWALSETGATGPTGNSYGDAPGHACVGISGPSAVARTLETGLSDRLENMMAFAAFALEALAEQLKNL